MVLRANTRFAGIGGHLSTYASAASLYEVGFNHFFRGKDGEGSGDHIFYQGHAAPGIYARAFLEGRLTEDQLDHFRRETRARARGSRSYPHPAPDAGVLGVPDGLDGPRPDQRHLPGPLQPLPRRTAACSTRADSRASGRSSATARPTSPKSLGALHVAAREGLDNLTFVVNCNLQRLDGPVRGNGKIIQELEAVFRGAGWNVIKVVWGREWDELLARDVDGVLVQQMNDDARRRVPEVHAWPAAPTSGSTSSGRIRACGKLVEHLTDDDLAQAPPRRPRLPQGLRGVQGRDASSRARRRSSSPRPSRAGRSARASRPATSPTRPRSCPRTSCASSATGSSCRSRTPAEGRAVLPPRTGLRGGRVPPGAPARSSVDRSQRRVVRDTPLPAPPREHRRASSRGGSQTPVSTTMVFTRILRNLIRDTELGPRIVPIIPDEARTFGMDPLFKEVGIYAALGQRYEPVDIGPRAQLPRGDGRPGARGGHHRGRLDGLVPGGRHGLCQPRPGR